MPTVGELQLEPGNKEDPKSGFRSAFSHSTEAAEPDYYKVLLEDDNIVAEMTATTRVGLHQYTFPASNNGHIILDLMHGIYDYADKNVWTFVRVENESHSSRLSTDEWLGPDTHRLFRNGILKALHVLRF
jgi:putative alpha-1,2-mannosidase